MRLPCGRKPTPGTIGLRLPPSQGAMPDPPIKANYADKSGKLGGAVGYLTGLPAAG